MKLTLFRAALALVFLFTASAASAQSSLSVTGTVQYGTNYNVQLTCSWPAVSGATKYRVLHSRSNTAGSAAAFVDTTATSSASGYHQNSSTTTCFTKSCTVWALNASNQVLATGSTSTCKTGCSGGGSCSTPPPTCDNDGWCEVGEDVNNCPFDCGNFCTGGAWCSSNQDCGFDGFCSNSRCACY